MLYGGYFTYVIQVTAAPAFFEGQNVVAYANRGWCFCEEIMSSLIKPSGQLLNLGNVGQQLDRQKSLDAALPTLVASRQPPMHPDKFAEHIRTKTFTNGSDCALVADIYRSFVECVTQKADELRLCKIGLASTPGWCYEEMVQLALALPEFQACELLDLSGHTVGDDGMAHLVPCLTMLPRLQNILFTNCGFGEVGLQALLDVLPDCRSLKYLVLPHHLRETRIGKAFEVEWKNHCSRAHASEAGLQWL
eukprot:8862147-Pyramimonas_sp.AAC.1